MAKVPKTIYRCTECGGTVPKWQGKCPHCGEWNTLQEDIAAPEPKTRVSNRGRQTARKWWICRK